MVDDLCIYLEKYKFREVLRYSLLFDVGMYNSHLLPFNTIEMLSDKFLQYLNNKIMRPQNS